MDRAQFVYIVAALGTVALIGTFYRMKSGFGPTNLRVLGLVLLAILAALFAAWEPGALSAATGIFGTMVGYLFGLREKEPPA